MSARAEELARQYDEVVDALVRTVGDVPEEVWTAISFDLGWTVAATTRHIASYMESDLEWLEQIARGNQTFVEPIEELHRRNAEIALAHAYADRDETLALVESAHRRGREMIAALSDAQLAFETPMDNFFQGDISIAPWVAAVVVKTGQSARLDAMIEHILIGHVAEHLRHIEVAIRQAESAAELEHEG